MLWAAVRPAFTTSGSGCGTHLQLHFATLLNDDWVVVQMLLDWPLEPMKIMRLPCKRYTSVLMVITDTYETVLIPWAHPHWPFNLMVSREA
jgi:hypothetical protein